MKIIEGMKRLRVIEKRMESQRNAVTEYASKLSTEMPRFQTKEDQAKEVASLIQSNNDLCAEYLRIKRSIEYTNLKVTVELQGKAYSISDLLVVKRKLADRMVATYRALNDTVARDRLRNAPKFDGETPKVEILYDERTKLDNIRKWQDLADIIDSRLEVINATTDLIEMEE
ncbi:MAG TPA: hypothetical protein PK849_12680 [Synergistales bacterium]|nr:hypothetical protein [Synergistaceae bacterium]HPE67028.1 hypothetical protein [Synergistales bacterium]